MDGAHDVRIFDTAAGFRSWLDEHHDTATELWVGYYKKGVPKTSMSYREAVVEALCYGWIDGIGKRIDDEVHTNRFTPRRKTSIWSAVNIAKVAELRTAGRMHPAGIRVFEERDRRKDAIYAYENAPLDFPASRLAPVRARSSRSCVRARSEAPARHPPMPSSANRGRAVAEACGGRTFVHHTERQVSVAETIRA